MSDTTENAPAPGVEADAPAPADDNPLAPAVAAEPPAEPEPEPPAPEPDPAAEAERKRIAQMAYDRRQAKREAATLRAELDAMRAAQPKPAANAPPTQADIERLVSERATQAIQAQRFNDECNAIYDAGTKEYPEFAKSVAAFNEIGGLPPALIEAAAEAGDAHRILHYLGQNLDEAERIMALPPQRMGAAVARLAAKASAPPPAAPVSKAPPPISPVGGGAKGAPDLEKMSMAEFVRLQDEADAKRRANR